VSYFTPGRPTGDPWEELLDRLAQAAGPGVAYARDHGVRLSIEPSRRNEASFVNSLPDAVDVAERTGLGIVADIGNSWVERNLRATLARAAPHLGLVQLTDVAIGTVVIGGLKDRTPVQGFISDLTPMRQLHLHAGFPGDHVKTAVELIRQGQVPTAGLLGNVVTVDGFGDALRLLSRQLPGRDAIRLSLQMTGT
jgi:sugar phosphate isomerase/epimerase